MSACPPMGNHGSTTDKSHCNYGQSRRYEHRCANCNKLGHSMNACHKKDRHINKEKDSKKKE